MKASLKKTLRVTTTKYEYAIVEAGYEYDTVVDGKRDVNINVSLNSAVDDLLAPELRRLYAVTDEEQGSFVIPYAEAYVEGIDSAN